MRKFLYCLTLIVICFSFLACGKEATISFAKSSIIVNFDEEYVIDEDDIIIKNSKSSFSVTILDNNIAQLDGLTIIPKNTGNTFVRFKLNKSDAYVDIPLTITHIVYATNIDVDSEEVVININENKAVFNKVTVNNDCNEQPEISYDKNVISYDFITGRITPIMVGETTVVVLYNNCNVSFKVNVIDIVYTTAIEVNDKYLYVGDSGLLNYSVFPSFANTYKFYTFSEMLTISEDGHYNALSKGEVTLYIEYYQTKENYVIKPINIKIIDKITSFDFGIINEDNSTSKYYLKEKNYRIKIDNVSNVEKQDIQVLSGWNVSQIVIDEDYIYIDGNFKNTGSNKIKIELKVNGETLVTTNEYEVMSVKDIKVVAKWSIYNQEPFSSDGKFHIFLNDNTGKPNSLKFALEINDDVINDTFEVYDITNERTKVNSTFNPSLTGEYVFEFVFMNEIVGEVVVVVE